MFRFTIRELVLLTLVAVAVFVLTSSTAQSAVTILLDVPHDNSSVRGKLARENDTPEAAVLLGLIEPLAAANRDTHRPGVAFPFGFDGQSREQIEKRLGKPVDWKVEEYARPAAGNEILVPDHIQHEDIDGLMERSKFYALKDVGGIWVFYSKDAVAILPVAVYLRTDADFVPLRRVEDMPKRLVWELPKLQRLRLWLGIPETVAKNAEGQWEVRPKPDE
jgi:hypothetical protein